MGLFPAALISAVAGLASATGGLVSSDGTRDHELLGCFLRGSDGRSQSMKVLHRDDRLMRDVGPSREQAQYKGHCHD